MLPWLKMFFLPTIILQGLEISLMQDSKSIEWVILWLFVP